ncbi:MAG: EAL domain-containing protein [Aquisalimonadaceae bacterium]
MTGRIIFELIDCNPDTEELVVRVLAEAGFEAAAASAVPASDPTGIPSQQAALVTQLEGALERGEFHLLYQPQVDLRSGAVACYEALLRWRGQEHFNIGVPELIRLLEKTGLIVDVAAWIIDEVCRQLAAWRAAGVRVNRLSVNVSAIEFREGSLVDAVRTSTARHGVSPRDLMMEITETVLLNDRARNLQILEELHQLGVGLALDDFGTGYSSLSYLRRFPVDFIKIDRSFIDNVTTNPDDAAITTAIISMAHALNKKVVAEGVEKEAQLGFLRRQGCDLVQGYYFERPMAPADVERVERSGQSRTVPHVQAMDDAATVLVVDDDPNITSSLRRLLRRDGYHLLIANDPETAFNHLALNDVDLVLADQRMPTMTGSELLSRVKMLYPETVRVVFSGYTDLTTVTEAVNAGAIYKFITKPWDDDALRATIADALAWRHRKRSIGAR